MLVYDPCGRGQALARIELLLLLVQALLRIVLQRISEPRSRSVLLRQQKNEINSSNKFHRSRLPVEIASSAVSVTANRSSWPCCLCPRFRIPGTSRRPAKSPNSGVRCRRKRTSSLPECDPEPAWPDCCHRFCPTDSRTSYCRRPSSIPPIPTRNHPVRKSTWALCGCRNCILFFEGLRNWNIPICFDLIFFPPSSITCEWNGCVLQLAKVSELSTLPRSPLLGGFDFTSVSVNVL